VLPTDQFQDRRLDTGVAHDDGCPVCDAVGDNPPHLALFHQDPLHACLKEDGAAEALDRAGECLKNGSNVPLIVPATPLAGSLLYRLHHGRGADPVGRGLEKSFGIHAEKVGEKTLRQVVACQKVEGRDVG